MYQVLVRSKIVLSSLIVALALMVSNGSAAILGNLNIANDLGGGVTISSTALDFQPGLGAGSFGIGVGTNMTFDAGSPVSIGTTGPIKDVSTGSLPLVDFLLFAAHPTLHLDLTGIGPGVLNTTAVNTFDPNSAPSSPAVGSPYILQATATGTVLSFSVNGIGRDSTLPNSLWSGLFTTQFAGVTPLQVQQTLVGGGTITSTWSASIIGAGVIPEPTSMGLILVSLLSLARCRRA